MPKYRVVLGDEIEHETKITIFQNPDKYWVAALLGLAAGLNAGCASEDVADMLDSLFISTIDFESHKDNLGLWRDVFYLVKDIE